MCQRKNRWCLKRPIQTKKAQKSSFTLNLHSACNSTTSSGSYAILAITAVYTTSIVDGGFFVML